METQKQLKSGNILILRLNYQKAGITLDMWQAQTLLYSSQLLVT